MEHAKIATFNIQENEHLFGKANVLEIFRYCISVSPLDAAAWDYNCKLPGLPVVKNVTVPPHLDLPDHEEIENNGRSKECCANGSPHGLGHS